MADGQVQHRKYESTAQEAMVSMLIAAGHLQRALTEVCVDAGITHDQYNVLRILRGAEPGGHPRYEIADRLIDRAPDVTRLLDRLERAKLIRRVRSQEDRRLSVSRITKAGLRLLERLDPQILGVHEQFAAPLSAAERQKLVRMCSSLLP